MGIGARRGCFLPRRERGCLFRHYENGVQLCGQPNFSISSGHS